MPLCPPHTLAARRHHSLRDGTSEEHVDISRKSRASGAVKSQTISWQGRDRGSTPLSLAGKPSQEGEAACPQLPHASAPAQAPTQILTHPIPITALKKHLPPGHSDQGEPKTKPSGVHPASQPDESFVPRGAIRRRGGRPCKQKAACLDLPELRQNHRRVQRIKNN